MPKSGSSLVFLAWQTLLLWHGEGQGQLFKCFVVFLRYLGQVREASGSMQQPTAHPTLPHSPPGTHPFLPKSGSSLVSLAWQRCCCGMVRDNHSCSSVWISSLGIWARSERPLVACSNPLRTPPCCIHRQDNTHFCQNQGPAWCPWLGKGAVVAW